MRFEFATATRIQFGAGVVREVAPLVTQMLPSASDRRALIVTGRTTDRAAHLIESLVTLGVDCTTFPVSGEPTVTTVRQAAERASEECCSVVVAMGGGSAIDAGKAVAALLTNPGHPLEYLEVIGDGKPLTAPPVPYVAIPTTAGTGAEVTRNAVLASEEQHVKVSLRSPLMLPRLAVVDPELTYGLPAEITAHTGLDALTQLVEAFVCTRASPMTDAVCREGIGRAARSLRRAYEHDDRAARNDMALASLFGGLALANAGLGAVHGFAGPIGGMFGAAHGSVCATLLPHVMAANVQALRDRQPASESLSRYDEVGRIVTGDAHATADQAVRWIRELCDALQVPGLSAYGISAGDFTTVIEKAAAASSMKPNPLSLTPEELEAILTAAL